MNLDRLLLGALYAFSTLFLCAFFLQRFRWRRNRRLGRRRLGFYPSSASMGNALQELQIVAQPQAQYILEEKLDEPSDEEDESGPEDPIAHLHKQAARLRKGEKLEKLTALLPQNP